MNCPKQCFVNPEHGMRAREQRAKDPAGRKSLLISALVSKFSLNEPGKLTQRLSSDNVSVDPSLAAAVLNIT